MTEQGAARPREFSQEITFKTAAKAPGDFNTWTFFWSVPQIDDDAELDYVVIQPDGGEYSRHQISGCAPGSRIRSDFEKDFEGGDPAVFHNEHVLFRLRVTKGIMKFWPPSTKFSFAFRKEAKIDAVADVDDSKLYAR